MKTKTIQMPNGLNFNKSVANPNSKLAKVIRYLRDNGPASKKVILRDVCDVEVSDKWVYGTNKVTRGWGATFFALAVKTNFINKTRIGSRVVYSVGKNWENVIL